MPRGVFVAEALSTSHRLFAGEPLGCFCEQSKFAELRAGPSTDSKFAELRAGPYASRSCSISPRSGSITGNLLPLNARRFIRATRDDEAQTAKGNGGRLGHQITLAAVQETERSRTTSAGRGQQDFRRQRGRREEGFRSFVPVGGGLEIPVLSPGAGALVRTLKSRGGGGESIAELLSSWRGALPDLLSALGELRRQQDWDRVIQVSKWLLESGRWAPEVGTWNGLIDAYGKSGQPDLAEETMRAMGATGGVPTTATWNVTMNAWAKSSTPGRAEALFSEMQERGYAPSVVSFNTVLDALGRVGSLKKAERVFASMKAARCPPSSTTFTLMINNYGRAGEPEKAEELFYRMRSDLRVPDIRAFTALIKAHARAGNPRSAEEWFLEMQESGWEPDLHAYNALIESYSRGGYPLGAAEVFQTMQEAQCRPDAASYNILLTAYSRQGLCQDAERTLDEMRTAGFAPSLASYTLLIGAYARAGRIPDAEAIVSAIESGLDPRPPTTATPHNPSNSDLGGGTTRPWRPLPPPRLLQPDLRLYNALLEAYGTAGMVGPMDRLFARMVDGSVSPLLSRRLGGGEEGQEREGEGEPGDRAIIITADVVSYNTVLAAYGQAGLVERAEELFERLRGEARVKPDAATWTTIMGVYASRKLLRKVTQLLTKMVKEGYEPDVATRKVLLSACRSKAQMEESEVLLKKLLA